MAGQFAGKIKIFRMQESFFAGIRVVELAGVLAGPAVGMFFAELGAEVIKVENGATGGDVTRQWKGPGEDPEASFSAYYASVNYGKQVLELDLRQADNREYVYALIREADIVVTNFRVASAKKLGVDPDTLRRLKPDLILAELSAFGPNSDRLGFDVVLQAEGGFLFMCGHPGSPPAKMPVALIDLLAAHQLKEGILCGLIHRMRTGQGTRIQVSLIDAAVASLANQATNWLMGRHIPQPMGTQHPNIAPYGDVFTTRDGKVIVLAAGTERHFSALCQVIGASSLAQDPDLATNARRVRNRDKLTRLLADYLTNWDRDALLQKLMEAGVPAGAIRNMQEVFEQPGARELLLSYELPDGQSATGVRSVIFQMLA